MNYFVSGLWHLAAAMAFAASLGALRGGDLTHFLYQPLFIVPCVLSSSALFFIPQKMAKKGAMKFLHYPLPDWDVLLLGPASHRHWITHSPLIPGLLVLASMHWGFLGENSMFRSAATGSCIGIGSHLFWDCIASRTHKIVVLPYWVSLRPAMSRVYLLAGALASLGVAFAFDASLVPAACAETPTKTVTVVIGAPLITTENTPSLKPVKLADVENPEGVSVAPNGDVYAVNMTAGEVVKIVDGKATTWLATSTATTKGVPNGTKFWKKTLFVADSGRKQVLAVAPDKSFQVIADAARDGFVNGPNDLAFAKDGSFYFTDPKWDKLSGVYYTKRQKDGSWKTTQFVDGIAFPNGVAVTRDGKHVYVGENQKNCIWKIECKKDGSAGIRTLIQLPKVPYPWNGPDGMRLDDRGRLFVAQFGNRAIQVLNPNGQVVATLDAGGSNPTNVAFSNDYKTLYVTEGETKAIYKIDIRALRK